MTPNLNSFVDELLIIKVAEERRWKFPDKKQWSSMGKNMLVYGAGAGVGSGLGYALRKKVLPKLLPQMGPKALSALSYGGGALLGLVSAAALKKGLGKRE